MTSFAVRVLDAVLPNAHVRVQVFAGPDEQHRALTGTLTMTSHEAMDFLAHVKMPAARP